MHLTSKMNNLLLIKNSIFKLFQEQSYIFSSRTLYRLEIVCKIVFHRTDKITSTFFYRFEKLFASSHIALFKIGDLLCSKLCSCVQIKHLYLGPDIMLHPRNCPHSNTPLNFQYIYTSRHILFVKVRRNCFAQKRQ